MGLFDFLKLNKEKESAPKFMNKKIANDPASYVDASSISLDERPFYRPDNYYTYYSYPGTSMAIRVIPFEERKQTTYPSSRGLYIAEIMLLEYCNRGLYPKPDTGYPGFWWFTYGIRDVGHALESLEERGFIQWNSCEESLGKMKPQELKQILSDAGLPTTGKKAELIDRILNELPEEKIIIPDSLHKYELTALGRAELDENGYVPYMHNHKHLTTEGGRFGEPFTVWDINKLFQSGDARNWRQVVGSIEKKRFGVDMADAKTSVEGKTPQKKSDYIAKRDEMRQYLKGVQKEIKAGIKTAGDGFEEESQGLDYKSIGKDKEALRMFYISIGKHSDAPALYRETAVILRKYGMYEEELAVLDAGINNVPDNNKHRKELIERREKVEKLIKHN